jgi:hypothetical protein
LAGEQQTTKETVTNARLFVSFRNEAKDLESREKPPLQWIPEISNMDLIVKQ